MNARLLLVGRLKRLYANARVLLVIITLQATLCELPVNIFLQVPLDDDPESASSSM
jgi:hypothetical protein